MKTQHTHEGWHWVGSEVVDMWSDACCFWRPVTYILRLSSDGLRNVVMLEGCYSHDLVCVYVLTRFSCVRLFATPMDYSPPGSSVHGILHARILEWVAISSSRGCFQHLHWQVESFTIEPPRKPLSSIYICRCFPFLNCLLPFTVIALIIIVAVIACIYWILTVCKYFSKYLMCIVTHVVLKIILWGRYYCVWICVC